MHADDLRLALTAILIVEIRPKFLFLFGERAGDRTQDPVIKSHVLYRLSYALA